MRIQRSSPTSQVVSPEREDQLVQQAVLLVVMDLHPIQVTASELVRKLARSPGDFSERDQIERAVRDLAGAGLLHRHDFLNRPDSLVSPTQAAFLARDLLLDEAEES